MSHFTVLVVGEDVDKQLAPYHEFECTGEDNEYVQDVDSTEEAKQAYESHLHGFIKGATFLEFVQDYYGRKSVLFGEKPDLAEEHKYGYVLLDENGDVAKVINRTNPNKKWDWYQIGGRWNGFFKLKAGLTGVQGECGVPALFDPDYKPPTADRADQCFKGDIDIEAMRDEAGATAAKNYDLFASVIEGLPPIVSWEEILEKHGLENIDAARDESARLVHILYHAQPAVKALRENKDTVWFEPNNFACSREEYIQTARDGALMTFAIVKDGKWHERGKMGWFAFVSNEKESGEWESEFNALIDSAPAYTLFTVVDCHI
jgi:hypothetical protein